MTIAQRVRERRKELGISADELGEMVGVSRATIFRWENGSIEKLDANKLAPIANALRTNVKYLIGWSNDKSPEPVNESGSALTNVFKMPAMQTIPVIGEIACGEPILAEENVEDYASIPANINADFALECKGDSMIGARILDGDLVCIRQQDDVTDGQIAAVLIDDEATLKRVYHNNDGTVTLIAENSKYPPKTIGIDPCENIRIIGLATFFISKVI